MEDPSEEWEIEEYSPPEKNNSKVRWILNKGLGLGKKIVVTSILVSSAPLVLPPILVISALGFAFSVPFGFVLTSYACTEKLMSKLLPQPPPPPFLLDYGVLPEQEEEYSGFGEVEYSDYAKDEKGNEEELMEDVELSVKEGGYEEDGEYFYVDENEPFESIHVKIDEEIEKREEVPEGQELQAMSRPKDRDDDGQEDNEINKQELLEDVDESAKKGEYEEDVGEYLDVDEKEPLESISVEIEGAREKEEEVPMRRDTEANQFTGLVMGDDDGTIDEGIEEPQAMSLPKDEDDNGQEDEERNKQELMEDVEESVKEDVGEYLDVDEKEPIENIRVEMDGSREKEEEVPLRQATEANQFTGLIMEDDDGTSGDGIEELQTMFLPKDKDDNVQQDNEIEDNVKEKGYEEDVGECLNVVEKEPLESTRVEIEGAREKKDEVPLRQDTEANQFTGLVTRDDDLIIDEGIEELQAMMSPPKDEVDDGQDDEEIHKQEFMEDVKETAKEGGYEEDVGEYLDVDEKEPLESIHVDVEGAMEKGEEVLPRQDAVVNQFTGLVTEDNDGTINEGIEEPQAMSLPKDKDDKGQEDNEINKQELMEDVRENVNEEDVGEYLDIDEKEPLEIIHGEIEGAIEKGDEVPLRQDVEANRFTGLAMEDDEGTIGNGIEELQAISPPNDKDDEERNKQELMEDVKESVNEEGYVEDVGEYLYVDEKEPLEIIHVEIEGAREKGEDVPLRQDIVGIEELQAKSPSKKDDEEINKQELVEGVNGSVKEDGNIDEGIEELQAMSLSKNKDERNKEELMEDVNGSVKAEEVYDEDVGEYMDIVEKDPLERIDARIEENREKDEEKPLREVVAVVKEDDQISCSEVNENENEESTCGKKRFLERTRDTNSVDNGPKESIHRISEVHQVMAAIEEDDKCSVEVNEVEELISAPRETKLLSEKTSDTNSVDNGMEEQDNEDMDAVARCERDQKPVTNVEETEKSSETYDVTFRTLIAEVNVTEAVAEEAEQEEIVRGTTGLLEKIRDGNYTEKSSETENTESFDDKNIEKLSGSVEIIEENGHLVGTREEENMDVTLEEVKFVVIQGNRAEINDILVVEKPFGESEEIINGRRDHQLEMEKENIINLNAESKDIINRNEIYEAGDDSTAVSENHAAQGAEKASGNKLQDAVCEELSSSTNVPGVVHAGITFETDNTTSSNEADSIRKEKIWEQICAVRTIVGYKATPQATCVEELKALYIFTGVEPPTSFEDDMFDLGEVADKLRFLMSIIGVK